MRKASFAAVAERADFNARHQPERNQTKWLSCPSSRTDFSKLKTLKPARPSTVKDVRDELVGNPQEAKPVVYLDEYDKGIILNKTNAKALVKVFGDDETTWPGKKIVLTTVPTRNPSTGEEIDAIRMQAVPAERKRKRRPKWPPPSMVTKCRSSRSQWAGLLQEDPPTFLGKYRRGHHHLIFASRQCRFRRRQPGGSDVFTQPGPHLGP